MRQVITIDNKIKKEPPCLLTTTVSNNMKFIIRKVKNNQSKSKEEHEKNSGINSKYYRGENDEVVKQLQGIYGKKCAFCECELDKPDIEHFRPQNLDQYYWLGYEWTNLLPICSICNGIKGKDFPISGISACDIAKFIDASGKLDKNLCSVNSQILQDEKCLLIHPELDNPEIFFNFLPNGKLQGIDNEGKGGKTIDVYGLNEEKMGSERIERGILIKNRKKILDKMIQQINFAIENYDSWMATIREDEKGLQKSNPIIRDKILSWFGKQPTPKMLLTTGRTKAKEDLKKSIRTEIEILHKGRQLQHIYSFVYNYIWNNFDDLVLPKFPPKKARDIKIIFDRYNDNSYE